MSLTHRLGIFALLLIIGIFGRLIIELPNRETILAATIIGSSLLGKEAGILIGLVSVAFTDTIIGNTWIFLFTWSAWALIGWFGSFNRFLNAHPFQWIIRSVWAGLFSTLFFYLWTNFGVWAISGMYPRTLEGLLSSYFMGLPFLRYHIQSTLIFVPSLAFLLVAFQFFFRKYFKNYSRSRISIWSANAGDRKTQNG